MGYGSCSLSGWERCGAHGDSNRRWTSADYVRWPLQSSMVAERKVPFHPGRSIVAHKPRAKFGDPDWPRRKLAEISAEGHQGVRRHKYCAGLTIGQPRRACAWQRPLAFCIREYHRTPKLVSNFITLRVPFTMAVHQDAAAAVGASENSRSPRDRDRRFRRRPGNLAEPTRCREIRPRRRLPTRISSLSGKMPTPTFHTEASHAKLNSGKSALVPIESR